MRRHALFHHRGLKVELHPRGNGGADDADQHVDVFFVPKIGARRRHEGRFHRVGPVGMGQHPGDDIGDVEERSGQKDLFNRLVIALDHDQPDNQRADRNADPARHMKRLQAGGHSDELGHHVGKIDDDQGSHHQEGRPQAVFFADQIAQSLAGHGAHARAHLLHDDQPNRAPADE